jgi:hypothetical protein
MKIEKESHQEAISSMRGLRRWSGRSVGLIFKESSLKELQVLPCSRAQARGKVPSDPLRENLMDRDGQVFCMACEGRKAICDRSKIKPDIGPEPGSLPIIPLLHSGYGRVQRK